MKAWRWTALFLAFGATSAAGDPVQSEIAITLPQGAKTLRSFVRFTDLSGAGVDTLEMQNQFIYGLTARTNLLLFLPVVRREEGGTTRRSSGLGDLSLLVKQQLWKQDRLQTQDRISLVGGVKFPTGESRARDRAGTLPPTLQPGSGSFDLIVGAFYAHDAPTGFFANILYTLKTEANGYRFGDVLRYDLAYARALAGGKPRQHFVWGVLELNGSITARDRSGGETVAPTGGHVLYLSPGLRLVHWSGRFVLDLSHQTPLVTHLNGNQPAPRQSWLVGVRANF